MTTIHVKEHVWKMLNSLKEPGETMNDVIERLLALKMTINNDTSINPEDPFFKLTFSSKVMPNDASEAVDDIIYEK